MWTREPQVPEIRGPSLQLVDHPGIGDVTDDGDHFTPVRSQPACRDGETGLVPIGEEQDVAAGTDRLGTRRTHRSGRPGHHGHPTHGEPGPPAGPTENGASSWRPAIAARSLSSRPCSATPSWSPGRGGSAKPV